MCDGTIVLIATFPSLYAILKTAYGGDGVITFGIPDLRSRIPVGASQVIALNTIGGNNEITLSQDNLPAISLTVSGITEEKTTGITATSTDSGHTHTTTAVPNRNGTSYNISGTEFFASAETSITSSSASAVITTSITDGGHSHTLSGTTSVLGSSTPFSVQNPYVAVNYIIYAGL